MAPAKKEVEPRVALYQKIFQLGEYLSRQKFIADGYNDAQGYEYVKSAYYRKVLGEACRNVGLVFKFNIANRIFTPLEKTKNMNLTTILGSISFIDPDTGEHEDYTIMGDGSDNLDKGIYKAETMMIKYFVLNNFLLPETQDEIDPENAKEDEKAQEPLKITNNTSSQTPPTKEERAEAKEEVVNDNAPTRAYVEEMISLIEQIQATGEMMKGKPYGEGTKANLQKFLNGEAELTKTKAVQMMTKIEEKADELGIE